MKTCRLSRRVWLNPVAVWELLDQLDISRNQLPRLAGISPGHLSLLGMWPSRLGTRRGPAMPLRYWKRSGPVSVGLARPRIGGAFYGGFYQRTVELSASSASVPDPVETARVVVGGAESSLYSPATPTISAAMPDDHTALDSGYTGQSSSVQPISQKACS